MIWVLVHCVLWLTQVWQSLMQGINGLHYMLTCHVQPKVAEEYCVWHRVHCGSVGQCGAVWAAPSHRLLLTITASPPAPTMEAPYVESCSAGFSMLNYFSAGREAGFVIWLNTFVSLFLPAVFHLSCLSKDRAYFVLSLFSLFSLSFSSFLSHLEFGQKCEICSDFKKMVKVSDFGQNWTLIKNLTLENKYVI